MELKPSQIFYSQDSILNRFGDYTQHGHLTIGETLDQLLNGYCNVNDIPNISVVWTKGKYFTADNRRLWVFRKAEEIGFLDTIEVYQNNSIKEEKLTTYNGGTSIRVRGNPGGRVWRKWKPKSSSSYRRKFHEESTRTTPESRISTQSGSGSNTNVGSVPHITTRQMFDPDNSSKHETSRRQKPILASSSSQHGRTPKSRFQNHSGSNSNKYRVSSSAITSMQVYDSYNYFKDETLQQQKPVSASNISRVHSSPSYRETETLFRSYEKGRNRSQKENSGCCTIL